MNKSQSNSQLLIFLTLAFASMTAAMMVLFRALYSGEWRFIFLIWNLFLAWLPFLGAWTALRKPFTAVIYGPLWLLFFPNAPYLVTDFIHLRPTAAVPLWYDAFLIFTFALTGLMLGIMSLYFMQALVARWVGRFMSWLFVIVTIGMSGYGVYVGRFLRWNSWDIFTQPFTLGRDILNSLTNPQSFPKTYTVSLSLSLMMLFAYLIVYILPQLQWTAPLRKKTSNINIPIFRRDDMSPSSTK